MDAMMQPKRHPPRPKTPHRKDHPRKRHRPSSLLPCRKAKKKRTRLRGYAFLTQKEKNKKKCFPKKQTQQQLIEHDAFLNACNLSPQQKKYHTTHTNKKSLLSNIYPSSTRISPHRLS
jgi:hypothetical protein